MAREVDIWWESGGRLKASMRWTNKRGRISFTLIPSRRALCGECPFINNPICSRWNKANPAMCTTEHLCNMLWIMEGDNKFEGRNRINAWQPLGPVKRERKKNRKI